MWKNCISLYPFKTTPALLVVEDRRFEIRLLVFLSPLKGSEQYKISHINDGIIWNFYTNSCTWKYVLHCVTTQTSEFDTTFLNKERVNIGVNCTLMDVYALLSVIVNTIHH